MCADVPENLPEEEVSSEKGCSESQAISAHSDQWYNKDPRLFQAEVAAMRRRFPKAAYGFMESTGNMYWVVTLNIFKDPSITKPWTFLLIYDKDHPHNPGIPSDSIKAVPLKPSIQELQKIAKSHGRPGVPHLIKHPNGFYLSCPYVYQTDTSVTSAVQFTARVVDWATHFEWSMRDDCIWNKWCNEDHMRSWQVTCKKETCDKRICPYGKRGENQ